MADILKKLLLSLSLLCSGAGGGGYWRCGLTGRADGTDGLTDDGYCGRVWYEGYRCRDAVDELDRVWDCEIIVVRWVLVAVRNGVDGVVGRCEPIELVPKVEGKGRRGPFLGRWAFCCGLDETWWLDDDELGLELDIWSSSGRMLDQ